MTRPEQVVAFLQNTWHRPGTDIVHIHRYRTEIDYRREHFAASMTGSRLVKAFGFDWYSRMWWDNACPVAAQVSNGVTEPDLVHIQATVIACHPKVVLTFGHVACRAVSEAWLKLRNATEYNKKVDLTAGITLFHSHHPNARYKTQDDLCLFAEVVKSHCALY